MFKFTLGDYYFLSFMLNNFDSILELSLFEFVLDNFAFILELSLFEEDNTNLCPVCRKSFHHRHVIKHLVLNLLANFSNYGLKCFGKFNSKNSQTFNFLRSTLL